MKGQAHRAAFYNCLFLGSQRSDTQYRHLQTLIVSYGMVRLYVCLSVSRLSQPCFNTETVTLVSYPGMANHRSLLNLNLIRPW